MQWNLALAACTALLAGQFAHAQSCTASAHKTIEQALQSAVVGDRSGARAMLERADRSCPTSFAVARDLAEAYDTLGDDEKAGYYKDRAERLNPNHVLTGPQPTSEAKSFVREKWALCVGISRFEKLDPSQYLEFPAKDAQNIARALTDPEVGRFRDDGQHVRVLTNEQATLHNIRSEIGKISREAGEDDLVVVFVSSHGTSADQDEGARKGYQTGYIVTYDTDPHDLYASAFAMEEMKGIFDRLRPKRVVVFLDTCFSGDTVGWVKGSKGLSMIPGRAYERIAQGTGRVVISSSSGSQQSWEGDQNGFFTICLIEALRQRNGLGTVTQLFASLQRTLPYQVLKAKNAEQTPMMYPDNYRSDIVIGTPIQ
jgi:uncharacterized caspase-like protein